MTFKTTVKDSKGNPVPYAIVVANDETSGKSFSRGTDGNGYADVALFDVPVGKPITLSVQAGGFINHIEYPTTSVNDQIINVVLDSFKKPSLLKAQLEVEGQFFKLSNNEPFTAVQVSDFNLLNRWQHGEDISAVLQQRHDVGFNMLRVWTAYDIPLIGTFLDIDYSKVPAFVELCARYGLYVEFTAYTGWNDPNHWTNLINASLKCEIRPILELVNELDQNLNEPDALNRIMIDNPPRIITSNPHEDYEPTQAPSPLLSSHGSNGSEARPIEPFWTYATFHTNDAYQWWRKVGHNAMEIWAGPTLSDENTRYPDRDTSVDHAFDAAAGAALLCVGSCFHSVRGKTSELWEGVELEGAKSWAAGAKWVNISCQAGPYTHRPDLEGPDDLRVYERPVSGLNCIVEIRK